MTDPIKQASIDGWIANHRKQYQTDPAAGHMWDAKDLAAPARCPHCC